MDFDEARRTITVLHGMERMRGMPCIVCSRPICGHEAVVCIALGYGSAPHCLECMADGQRTEREAFRDGLLAYILERECYKAGWLSAGEAEGFGRIPTPNCLWRSGDRRSSASSAPGRGSMEKGQTGAPPVLEWDAGDTGCGDLVMELRNRLNAMKPGDLLKLTARDPGAKEDLPAWCRLTGHSLVESGHPIYLIRRRED